MCTTAGLMPTRPVTAAYSGSSVVRKETSVFHQPVQQQVAVQHVSCLQDKSRAVRVHLRGPGDAQVAEQQDGTGERRAPGPQPHAAANPGTRPLACPLPHRVHEP